MSVDSASIITPDASIWSSNVSMTEMQNECVNKIAQDDDLVLDILNIKFTFLTIFIKMTQEIRRENSLDSLDSLVNNICYPALDEDKLYSLMMNVARICLNKIDNFTNEDRQLIKNKLERVFCSIYMKLGKNKIFPILNWQNNIFKKLINIRSLLLTLVVFSDVSDSHKRFKFPTWQFFQLQ